MGNLVSVVAHTQAGQEVVLDLDSHIYNYEVAGGTVVGSVQMQPRARLHHLSGQRPADHLLDPARDAAQAL